MSDESFDELENTFFETGDPKGAAPSLLRPQDETTEPIALERPSRAALALEDAQHAIGRRWRHMSYLARVSARRGVAALAPLHPHVERLQAFVATPRARIGVATAAAVLFVSGGVWAISDVPATPARAIAAPAPRVVDGPQPAAARAQAPVAAAPQAPVAAAPQALPAAAPQEPVVAAGSFLGPPAPTDAEAEAERAAAKERRAIAAKRAKTKSKTNKAKDDKQTQVAKGGKATKTPAKVVTAAARGPRKI